LKTRKRHIFAKDQSLGRNFAEKEQNRNHDQQVDPFIIQTQYPDNDCRRYDRSGNINQYIADKDGKDKSTGLAE